MVVGHLNKAHGTKGELFIWPLTDYPGSHFAPGVVLFVAEEDSADVETSVEPGKEGLTLEVESVRPFRKGFLVRFVGIESRTQAEELKDLYVIRPFEEMDELEAGEVYYHELLGATVITVDDERVGTVREVFALKPADMLDVTSPDGSIMIPFIPEIVVSVDRAEKKIVIDPPEGLLQV